MSGAPSASPFLPLRGDDPVVVGGYRLVAVLGEGGMGKVYLSYTPGGRPLALKVIRSELSGDPEFRRRFQQEVHAAQRVQGLYTAPVIDCDTDGPQPWLATAYVPGPSLAHAVSQQGALPLRSVLLLTVGVAEALHVIHAAGIVHRDLKPANVLLASDGPRVIDFGIARAADATALTATGVSIGTPAFMAPEQAASGTVTAATDIFALGQIAAFAGIGAPAYGDGPSHAVLYRIVHEEPDLSRLPPELRPLVARCLSRDPAGRPALNEIIERCQEISPDPLRQGEDWLPQTLAGAFTERRQLPQPARTPPPAAPTPTAYSPHVPPPGAVDPHAPTAFDPATARPVPNRPGMQPAGPGHPPTTGYLPLTKKPRGLIVVGAVVAAVVGLVVIRALLPDGSGKDESKSPGASNSAGTTSGGASSNGKQPDPKAATYKGITLPDSYHLMLADNPPRPIDGPPGAFSNDGDLYFHPRRTNVVEQDEIGTGNGKLVLLNNAQKGSLDTCRSETRYTETIHLDQLSNGSQFCVLSNAGHIAVATYHGRSPKTDPSTYISLDLTIWRNAAEPKKDG
ncbi:serine/threonine protein kinase [Streptomyces sp. H39-S7]|uniref:serine/threonine protein kinase n=1 Tax=Streptomyces sp. H39-S7 TaxID=3004357 RepID=UPI0022B05373|nr:serine/threonine-protein kinase [Streptomyces sp. H39-S7]MCZ4124202.1 serine/threonine-protein kinase [Streptomyces sp. H39-S7]